MRKLRKILFIYYQWENSVFPYEPTKFTRMALLFILGVVGTPWTVNLALKLKSGMKILRFQTLKDSIKFQVTLHAKMAMNDLERYL